MARDRALRKELGAVWKQRLGKHYPAMALVAVTALFEPEALVEIQAVAHIGASP
jgi:enamine deaminase RidA (YjgF/YER057c/UK114 family)